MMSFVSRIDWSGTSTNIKTYKHCTRLSRPHHAALPSFRLGSCVAVNLARLHVLLRVVLLLLVHNLVVVEEEVKSEADGGDEV